MNSKKILSAILSCALAGALLTGCGTPQSVNDVKQNVDQVKDAAEQKVDEAKDAATQTVGDVKEAITQKLGDKNVGMLSRLNPDEEVIRNVMTENSNTTIDLNIFTPKVHFYDSLPAMEAALESGEVDQISTYKSVADYIVANNPNFEIVTDIMPNLSDSLCFAMRNDDDVLKRQINVAIEDMTRDGVLAQMVKDYITDVDKSATPPSVMLEYTEGFPPLRIAVTGDLPPLDMILDNGEITGFNTAMLAELGRRLARNVEVVPMDSASRAAALQSGEADISFWAIVPSANEKFSAIDMPAGLTLTNPYFKDTVVHVALKK